MDEIEKGMQELKPIRQALENSKFTFSDNYAIGCSFLFPDGKYLNLTENNNRMKELLGDRGPVAAHHLLDRCIDKLQLITEEDEVIINEYNDTLEKPVCQKSLQQRIVEHTDRAIVLNDGTNFRWENSYIDLPVTGNITSEQLNKLTLWIDNVVGGVQSRLDVGHGNNIKSYQLKGCTGTTTDEIIKDIKRLYHMI